MTIQIQDKIVYTVMDWKKWIRQGDQYLKAVGQDGQKSRFGTDIRYNLLSMSLESYVMVILDFHRNLPDNHTYSDLIEGLERVILIESELKNRILEYENIQSICSIEKYHRNNQPEEKDMQGLRSAILHIRKMAYQTCSITAVV
jgi:hypothetical protein